MTGGEGEAVRAELRITGRVQGVFYRASAQGEAQKLSLTGEIRNLPDGSVEAVVEGPRGAIEEFVAWSRRGPRGAGVENVVVRWGEAQGEFRTFRVTR